MDTTKVYLGIDIGGTNSKIAIVNPLGEYFDLSRYSYGDSKPTIKTFLENLFVVVDMLVDKNRARLAGIGIACPGLQMENGHGTLTSVNMPLLKGVDLKAHFEKRYQLPVSVINDLVAHSMAESHFGLGRGIERFLTVSLGTGIGHAFIYRGKPQYVMNGISGDSGRMVIDPVSEIQDSSGVFGSAEALCGVNAIELLAKEYYPDGPILSAREVISKARDENDPMAVKIMSVISRRLALLLINLSSIYFPETISVSGGQTEAGPFFIEECQKEFDRRASGFFNEMAKACGRKKGIKIRKSSTGGLSGLIGSIVSYLE